MGSVPPESSSPEHIPCPMAVSFIVSFAILWFCFHHILLTLSGSTSSAPPLCLHVVSVWFVCSSPGHVWSAGRPHTPSEASALSLSALVLLYFSSVVLFSFSTLPLYSEDRLEVARMQGLGEPAALLRFGSCHSINCLDSKSCTRWVTPLTSSQLGKKK